MSLLLEENKRVLRTSPAPILWTPLTRLSPPSANSSGTSAYYTARSSTISPGWKHETGLKLNFNYRRLPYRLQSDNDISSDSSISSNDDLAMCKDVNLENFCLRKPVSFIKYIPLPSKRAHKVPKIEHNKIDPKEWKDCQKAYLSARANSNLFVRNSKSDTGVLSKDKPDTTPKKKKKLTRFIKSAVRGCGKQKIQDDVQPENVTLPKRNNPRFNEKLNIPYFELNTKDHPEFFVQLYAQVPADGNYGMCHVMTELVVSAMLNFFHPYGDVQCFWLSNLQDKILQEIRKPNVRAKFSKLVYLGRFEAMLVLSKEAGALLRHRDMCFLHSIAAALQIGFHRLLVLVDETCTSESENHPGTQ